MPFHCYFDLKAFLSLPSPFVTSSPSPYFPCSFPLIKQEKGHMVLSVVLSSRPWFFVSGTGLSQVHLNKLPLEFKGESQETNLLSTINHQICFQLKNFVICDSSEVLVKIPVI